MTSAQIAHALSISEIEINYRFSEWLGTWLYKNGDPLPNLEIKNKKIESLNQDFMLHDVKFNDYKKYESEIKEVYPEDGDRKNKRIKSCMVEMNEDFVEQINPMEAYIVVSHMWFHSAFRVGVQRGSGGDYCSISAVKFETGKEKEILMQADNKHLME